MSQSTFEARRATVEDVPALREFWSQAGLPEPELEKRFTDFQIAITRDGMIVGTLGLHIQGLHGHVHYEVFLDASLTDSVRPMLWERVRSVARNRGVARLWTLEPAPFWHGEGFTPATEEERANLPGIFGDPEAKWRTFKLREEIHASLSPDHEFALFRASAREDTERMERQAKFMKGVATVIAIVLFILAFAFLASFVWYKNVRETRTGISIFSSPKPAAPKATNAPPAINGTPPPPPVPPPK